MKSVGDNGVATWATSFTFHFAAGRAHDTVKTWLKHCVRHSFSTKDTKHRGAGIIRDSCRGGNVLQVHVAAFRADSWKATFRLWFAGVRWWWWRLLPRCRFAGLCLFARILLGRFWRALFRCGCAWCSIIMLCLLLVGRSNGAVLTLFLFQGRIGGEALMQQYLRPSRKTDLMRFINLLKVFLMGSILIRCLRVLRWGISRTANRARLLSHNRLSVAST